MQVVFELRDESAGAVYVVDVLKVDETDLRCLHKGKELVFPLADITNAFTVTGRTFSLRPYDAASLVKTQ